MIEKPESSNHPRWIPGSPRFASAPRNDEADMIDFQGIAVLCFQRLKPIAVIARLDRAIERPRDRDLGTA
jgi:hypothetical protein